MTNGKAKTRAATTETFWGCFAGRLVGAYAFFDYELVYLDVHRFA
jgi:hypothetical protein